MSVEERWDAVVIKLTAGTVWPRIEDCREALTAVRALVLGVHEAACLECWQIRTGFSLLPCQNRAQLVALGGGAPR